MMPRSRPLLLGALLTGLGLGVGLTVAVQELVRPANARIDPAATASLAPRATPAGSYWAQVLRVIDGDTIEARVHVWMGQEIVTRVRLAGIDAPELNGACAAESDLARRALDRLALLLGTGPVLLSEIRPDKYFGRVGARLLLADNRDAGEVLTSEALARVGTRRFSWC
jgi:endonuclease YncB( thermonuclease family)